MTLRKVLFSERKKRMKKSKTRAFSLLLSLLLSLCLLCGCGNQAVEVEANTAQTQEEILTPVQTKREKKTKKTESATKEETKKEETKAVEERKNSSADLITDEKLTEDKKEQEETAQKAAEAKAKADAEAKAKAEAEAKAKAEEEAKRKAEEEKKKQEEAASSGKTCTISISCSTILNNMDKCDPAISGIIPSGGTILSATTVEFTDGETVYDVLQRVCQSKGIQLEASWSPTYNSAYIEGIANIYEFDVGSGSGWMYKVNGQFPNYGCSSYSLKGGESICWVYTCNLGSDVGGGNW